MKFSIPYNGYNDLFKRLKNNFGEAIHEIYLAPDRRVGSTGRSNDGFNKKNHEGHADYRKKIINLMSYCEKTHTKINILFNGSFTNFDLYSKEGFDLFINYIDDLYRNYYVTDITIIDPYIIKPLKEIRDVHWKNLKIHASVNLYGSTVNRLNIIESLGADNICLDRDINRDLRLLKIIRDNTNMELKLLVNEGCLLGCPFRKYHHERKEIYTGETELILDLRKSLINRFNKPISTNLAYCLGEYKKNPQQLFRSPFVRPEDLYHYSDIIDVFKIAGREMMPDRLEEIVSAYVTGSYDGNFLKLIFRFYENLPYAIDNKKMPKNFFEKMQECTQNCKSCGYCNSLCNLIEQRKNLKSETWVSPNTNENLFILGQSYYEMAKYDKALECLIKIPATSDQYDLSKQLASECESNISAA